MVREDILAAIQNAIERGESIEQAKQTMINSGYVQQEVEEAISVLVSEEKEPSVELPEVKEQAQQEAQPLQQVQAQETQAQQAQPPQQAQPQQTQQAQQPPTEKQPKGESKLKQSLIKDPKILILGGVFIILITLLLVLFLL